MNTPAELPKPAPKPMIQSMKPSERLAELNRQIDERLREAAADDKALDARTEADPKVGEALKVYQDAVKAAGEAQLARMPLSARWKGHVATNAKTPEAVKVRGALDAAEAKVAAAEKERDQRAIDLRDARNAAGARVTVKAGGTSYTVANTTEALARLRDTIAKGQGFDDRGTPKPAFPRNASAATVSKRAPKTVVQDFVADGDFENAQALADHYGLDIKAGMDAKQKQAYQDWQDGPPPPPPEPPKPAPPSVEPLTKEPPASPPPAKGQPESLGFDEWVKQGYRENEYAQSYLEAHGEEKRAMLASVVGTTNKDMPLRDLLKEAHNRYWNALMGRPRDATMPLEVWDSLPHAQQVDAQRHFFNLDNDILRRDQQRAKAAGEARRKAQDSKAP